ncbi:baseplate hub [Synechococcus phage S-SCSM1]|uniref:Baseplate hub subunit n=1 Tax=Synechococcus phage S-SCSM1 TaxID=2588487 RepID=A0A6M2ZJ87_9CAUD|nr:baseplate hub [Synechococcus phage S-SCSM1]QFG06475.1 baseplate hub subunit [Synechococcus phage S-SCSM1]
MPLPTIATPTFELELPSTGKTVEYRPFLVKEEKVLLYALESENQKQITNAVKTVIKNCVQTKGVKIETLPTFDIEYLFLNIRAKSVGEEIELNLICPDDGETEVPVTINVDDINVRKNPDHDKQIKLDDNIMIEMKYPSLNEFVKENFDSENLDPEKSFELIASCVDKIYTEEEVWETANCTKKELMDFVEQMNSTQFRKLEQFFVTMPKLSYTVPLKNPVTGVESEVVLEGLASFFA